MIFTSRRVSDKEVKRCQVLRKIYFIKPSHFWFKQARATVLKHQIQHNGLTTDLNTIISGTSLNTIKKKATTVFPSMYISR